MSHLKLWVVVFLISFSTALIAEEKIPLELASPFVDNMILQREMKVPVWGWAKAGTKVTVSFSDQTKSASADKQGKWMIHLDPLEASAVNREFLVSSDKGEKLICKDVLVGEVWLVSGQSNMDWLAGKSNCRNLANEIQQSKPEIPIREYLVDTGSALFPRNRTVSTTGWKKSTGASGFSAIALSFSWSLYQELKVPIGLLRSTHGATQVETWTAYEGFASHPKLQDIASKINSSDPSSSFGIKSYKQYYEDLKTWQKESETIMNRGGSALARPPLPGIADEWRGPSRMYNMKINPLVPYAIRGAIWNQGESNSSDGRAYAYKMEALINGWRKNWEKPNLPFYFTQMQCYGDADPNNIGFADIREAQRLFFMNSKHVGMALQHDFNPGNTGQIHYSNKLDPGSRMARWALANDYGKDIAYTGPIYKSHKIKGNEVRVTFEQRGKGGSLMIGSKGLESDANKNPEKYVEPAVETKEANLKHFRLSGKDKIWHAAEAIIDGNDVIVTCKEVANPVGVQYAYSASPVGANLYNVAGLPATPFAYFDGKQMFKEDDPEIVAREKAEAERKWGKKVYLLPATLFRNGVVLQRDAMVPVWGHGVPGTTVTVAFDGQKKTAKVDEFEKWSLTLDPLKATNKGRDLIISSSDGAVKTIKDVVVGDVWFMTGGRNQTNPMRVAKDQVPPAALLHVREFRQRTNSRRFREPRKKRMEIGGGKYEASWQLVDFDNPTHLPTDLAYNFASQLDKDIPIGIINMGVGNPPLTWISYEALQTAKGFEKERDELNLGFPNTDSCKNAINGYIETLTKYNQDLLSYMTREDEIPLELALAAPAFPQPVDNRWAKRTETATKTYNFSICPLSPFAIKGMVWIPAEDNISTEVSRYAPSLKIFAENVASTFGQEKALFLYVQPTDKLVPGVTDPSPKNSKSIKIDQWPKDLKEIAAKLGALAAGK